MGAITTNNEAPSTVPAAKMYKGLLLDGDEILPKILPQVIKSITILEGDGGVGTIKEVAFGEAVPVEGMKQRVDAVDKDALTYSYSVIGGDILMGKIESIANHFTVVPTDGGCIVKNTATYTPIGDEVIPEENLKQATEQSQAIFKAVEAYLLAN